MGREEGSGWGTHVYLWQIHFDIWQNQYNIVKLNKIKFKKNTFSEIYPPKRVYDQINMGKSYDCITLIKIHKAS